MASPAMSVLLASVSLGAGRSAWHVVVSQKKKKNDLVNEQKRAANQGLSGAAGRRRLRPHPGLPRLGLPEPSNGSPPTGQTLQQSGLCFK